MSLRITSPQVTNLLDTLYADAAANDPLVRQSMETAGTVAGASGGYYQSMRKAYMAVGSEFGYLLYSLARSTGAETIVEFGTSFGVSTIFLAAAVADNGRGRVITTEYEPEKAAQARKNLIAAGLEDWVEFRVGDARETLADRPSRIDMIFLDGAKDLYLGVLKLLEPALRPGGVVASDNTDFEGMDAFLDYIHTPAHGYISSGIFTAGPQGKAHEVTIRL